MLQIFKTIEIHWFCIL